MIISSFNGFCLDSFARLWDCDSAATLQATQFLKLQTTGSISLQSFSNLTSGWNQWRHECHLSTQYGDLIPFFRSVPSQSSLLTCMSSIYLSKSLQLFVLTTNISNCWKGYRKLFACDVKNSVIRQKTRNFLHFSFHGRPVSKVEIAGTVVAVSRRECRIVFHVDDGTEVLKCLKNFYPEEDFGHYEAISVGISLVYIMRNK